MPRKVLIQPNGKYGIYSSVVDNLVHYNLTEDQCIETFIRENNLSLQDAKGKVDRAKNYNWEEDMYFSLYLHGAENTYLTECGMSKEEVRAWVEKAELDHKKQDEIEEVKAPKILTDEQKRLLVYEHVLDTIYKNCCGKGGVCPFCGAALWAEEIEHENFCASLLIVRAQSADTIEIDTWLQEIQNNE